MLKQTSCIVMVVLIIGMVLCIPVSAATAQPNRIVCIGDSITAGRTDTNNWPHQLQTRLGDNWQVINMGVGGDTTTQMLARMNTSLSLKPQYIIIAGGINDRFLPLSTTKANIDAMCKLAIANGATPVLCTITPSYYIFGPDQLRTNIMNPWILHYASAHGYAVIDFHAVINIWNIEPPIGLHPTNAGYVAMGNTIDLRIFKG